MLSIKKLMLAVYATQMQIVSSKTFLLNGLLLALGENTL